MFVVVEPTDGHEIERMITALLNVTGVVHRVVDSTAHAPNGSAEDVIGAVADRLRGVLSVMTEHIDDDELAAVTGVLAQTTLLVADELGLEGYFSAG